MDIIICDDNRAERGKYRELVVRLGKKYGIPVSINEFNDGCKLLSELKAGKLTADIIYLDIHMPEKDGVSAAAELRKFGCISEIVFLTVSDRHQLPAFDVEAFNYIIKGVCSEARFESVFLRAVKKAEEKKKEFVCFTAGGESRTLYLEQIRFFEIRKRIVTVHYGKGEEFEFHSSMEKLESQLTGRGFLRIHRSIIVYMEQIHALTYREMKLRDGTILPMGRSYYQGVKTVLQEKYGLCL